MVAIIGCTVNIRVVIKIEATGLTSNLVIDIIDFVIINTKDTEVTAVIMKTIRIDSLWSVVKYPGLLKLKMVNFKVNLHFFSSEILRFSFLESNKYL